MVRKKLQFKTEGYEEIKFVFVSHRNKLSSVKRLMQALWKHFLIDAEKKFATWKEFAFDRNNKLIRGFGKLNTLLLIKQLKNKKEAFSITVYYGNVIIRIIEKIEKVYLLERHKLVSEIMTIYSRDGIERLTTTAPPPRFTQRVILKKNGYKYLGLLLRKFVKKRTVAAFDWYSRITGIMRYACVLSRMVERGLKQRG